MDPYVVTRLITETVCDAFESGRSTNGASANGAASIARTVKTAKAKAGARKK